MSTLIQTEPQLPTAVISNGAITGNEWTNPDNLLLTDGDVAASNPNNAASDVIVGNFNAANVPSDAIVTGIEVELIGAYSGEPTSPPITITPYFVDNTSGENVYYAYQTPQEITPTPADYVLGSSTYLFGTSLTADQINNAKIALVANGNAYVDAVKINVFYYVPDPIDPPDDPTDSCSDCNSPIQAQPFYLALPFLATDTKCVLKSFNYPDGTPIVYEDLGACGGYIDLTFDPGKPKQQGSNFEENAFVGVWTVLTNGYVELDFVTLENRGRAFHTPYDHDADLLSDHDANSMVIISNSGHYEDRFLRKCQIDVLVSAPITVQDEGVDAVTAIHDLNFIGPNVQVEVDPMDPRKADVTILETTTNTEVTIDDDTEGTTGSGTDSSLTFAHTVTTANYLRVWISTQNAAISGVTYNGVAMTLIGSEINAAGDLKVALYGLINPAAGTHNVIVSMGSSVVITAGAVSFNDVDTSNPTDGVSSGAFGSSTAPSDSATTSDQNTLLMDVVGAVHNTTSFTQAYPWTVRSQINASTRPGASSTRRVLTPATVTDTYTISPTGFWAILVAGVRGIATPSGGVQSVTGLDTDNTDPANPIVKVGVDGVTVLGDGTPGNPLRAPGTGASGERIQKTFSQTGHGFSEDEVVHSSGTDGEFSLAEGDVPADAEVTGIISDVPDVDTLTIVTEGFLTLSALPGGAVAGDILFLDPAVPGGLTLTGTSVAGEVNKPVAEVINAVTKLIYWHNYRGQEQQSTPASSENYTVNADETNNTWHTVQVDLPGSGISWTAPTYTLYANGSLVSQNGSTDAYLAAAFRDMFPGSSGTEIIFGTGARSIRVKFDAAAITPAGTGGSQTSSFTGFIAVGDHATQNGDPTSNTNKRRVGFAFYNGDRYIMACDGTAITATLIDAYSSQSDVYTIVYTSWTSVEFFINGVSVGTISTNLPVTGDLGYEIVGVNTSGGAAGFRQHGQIVFSEKLI